MGLTDPAGISIRNGFQLAAERTGRTAASARSTPGSFGSPLTVYSRTCVENGDVILHMQRQCLASGMRGPGTSMTETLPSARTK